MTIKHYRNNKISNAIFGYKIPDARKNWYASHPLAYSCKARPYDNCNSYDFYAYLMVININAFSNCAVSESYLTLVKENAARARMKYIYVFKPWVDISIHFESTCFSQENSLRRFKGIGCELVNRLNSCTLDGIPRPRFLFRFRCVGVHHQGDCFATERAIARDREITFIA